MELSGESCLYFNSRPHGGRHVLRLLYPEDAFISTHALTEGDTVRPVTYRFSVFQLTPSRRATQKMPLSEMMMIFQLTPSRRATYRSDSICIRNGYFNSRPHGGRHTSDYYTKSEVDISTHALTEGDATSGKNGSVVHIFQLTPSRRATLFI